MNINTPTEFVNNYAVIGEKKANNRALKVFLLAILAGSLIALGASVTSVSTHTITDVSTIRTISGLLFPFGLIMVILMGTELFTGNCLISISVLSKKTTVQKMIKNLVIVYFGNFIGAILIAVVCAYFGQFNYTNGMLGVYSVKLAAAKCSMPFINGIVLGIMCNILVCAGVVCSLMAKDVVGRAIGAYIPVAFFVICGFEHCIANMYTIPAGLFAMTIDKYSTLVTELGINTNMLSWSNFIFRNLVPVTIGNIIGGVLIGSLLWYCHKEK